MRFMKVPGKKDYYLGECNDDGRRVYIPTLNKYFSYEDVYFEERLTGYHLDDIFVYQKKLRLKLMILVMLSII